MMNYANMIEEKKLKKTFIIATLCSTLIGTFTSSMGLWDRVNEKRKQKRLDSKQNTEIKQLKDQFERAEKRAKERDGRLYSGPGFNNGMMPDGLPGALPGGGSVDPRANFQLSGDMIQRQFDEGYERLGRRFARGDALTENALQAQVIALQQTVITVLQDALVNDRQLSPADLAKLIAASNSAREGSLDALRKQQQRLAIEPRPDGPLFRRTPSPPTPQHAPLFGNSDPLFCRYAVDLQYIPNKPLAADFAPRGQCRCPDCGTRIPVSADDFWKIGKATPVVVSEGSGREQSVVSKREFILGQRFVAKCHTPDGQYACVLCHRHGDADAVCRTVDALINHVGRFHDVRELELEVDVGENRKVVRRLGPLALPPPPLPLPKTRADSVVSGGRSEGSLPLKSAMKKGKEVSEFVYR